MLSLAQAQMFTVRVRIFQASWESVFPRPVPLVRVPIEAVAEELLTTLSSTGLTADQIALIKSNDLYGYELRFPLFRGNAAYSQNAQRVRVDFANAVGPTDVTTIIDTISKCLAPIKFPSGTTHQATVGRQCEFVSPGDFQKFFSPERFEGDLSAVKLAGAILYVTLPDWPKEIVVTLDPSILIHEGIWIYTRSSFNLPDGGEKESVPPTALTPDVLRVLSDVFEKAVSKCNLQLAWP